VGTVAVSLRVATLEERVKRWPQLFWQQYQDFRRKGLGHKESLDCAYDLSKLILERER
jgi:hypothetical protein